MTDFTMTRSQIIKHAAKRILALKWQLRKINSDYQKSKREAIEAIVGTKRGWRKVHTLETATALYDKREDNVFTKASVTYILYREDLKRFWERSRKLQAIIDKASKLEESTECRVSLEDARLLFDT